MKQLGILLFHKNRMPVHCIKESESSGGGGGAEFWWGCAASSSNPDTISDLLCVSKAVDRAALFVSR